jgi:hypothetical protein
VYATPDGEAPSLANCHFGIEIKLSNAEASVEPLPLEVPVSGGRETRDLSSVVTREEHARID